LPEDAYLGVAELKAALEMAWAHGAQKRSKGGEVVRLSPSIAAGKKHSCHCILVTGFGH
jgi:hypothetical protein